MRNTRAVRNLIRARLDEEDLEGLAREQSEQALRNNEVILHLGKAIHHANLGEDALEHTAVGSDSAPADRKQTEQGRLRLKEAFRNVAWAVILEAVKTELFGYKVDLRRSAELECPVCNEIDFVDSDGNPTIASREVIALGAVPESNYEHTAAWVCRSCGSVFHEHINGGVQFEIVVDERGPHPPAEDSIHSA